MVENKYQYGKIYKIVDAGYNRCYIGSTYQLLSNRIADHRKQYKLFLAGKKVNKITVQQIFEEYGLDNCKIELIEQYPCNSKEELLKQEGFHIKNNECVNKHIPGRSKLEYRMDRKDYISQRSKKYREQNLDSLREKQKERYKRNKERIMEKHKEYYEKNKEKELARVKAYTEAHKEQVEARMSQIIECPLCGIQVSYRHKARHERSKTQSKLQELSNNKGDEIVEIVEI